MIGPINTSTNGASNSISKESQQEIEYKQPQINESQNYQNQLIEISDDMSMVATLFSQRLGKLLDKKANKGQEALYIAEEGADEKLDKVMLQFRKSGRSLQELYIIYVKCSLILVISLWFYENYLGKKN